MCSYTTGVHDTVSAPPVQRTNPDEVKGGQTQHMAKCIISRHSCQYIATGYGDDCAVTGAGSKPLHMQVPQINI